MRKIFFTKQENFLRDFTLPQAARFIMETLPATNDVQPFRWLRQCVAQHHLTRSEEYTMARAKTPRASKGKTKIESNVLRMPEAGNGNGNAAVPPAELESEIRQRAYELFEQRGYADGEAEQDWFQAEREVLERHASQKHSA